MTGSQSRLLDVGPRLLARRQQRPRHRTEKTWAGVTLKWDNRSQQTVLHNDMAGVGMVLKSKDAPPELKCSACDGTGFQAVAQSRPSAGGKIYPPPCKRCLGKGRIRSA